MHATSNVQPGTVVICADGVPLGTVVADEGGFLRVHRDGVPPTVWVTKEFIEPGGAEGEVHLILNRDDLHDGVIALPPARQREYGTLEALSLLARRARAARARSSPSAVPGAHPVPSGPSAT
jgi:hypothetical protein